MIQEKLSYKTVWVIVDRSAWYGYYVATLPKTNEVIIEQDFWRARHFQTKRQALRRVKNIRTRKGSKMDLRVEEHGIYLN